MDEKETVRLEAFSDGVFAVAVTFLDDPEVMKRHIRRISMKLRIYF